MAFPDPDELKDFASEPVIFLPRDEMTREVEDDSTIVFKTTIDRERNSQFPGVPRVRFRLRPAYITAEDEDGEYERVTEGYDHEDILNTALDTSLGGDYFIATTQMVRDGEMTQFEAYWLLDRIEFDSPAIKRE